MEKTKALELFINKEAKDLSQLFVAEAMSHMRKEKKREVTEPFCGELCRVLNRVPSLRFLQIALVRSKALAGLPLYRLTAYGASFYLEAPLYEAELPLEWLYQAYKRFSEGIVRESRKYAGRIGTMETEQIILIELETCQKIMKFLFSETLPLLLKTQEFQALDMEQSVQFQLSEIMGQYKILLVKDKNLKRMEGFINELLQTEAAK